MATPLSDILTMKPWAAFCASIAILWSGGCRNLDNAQVDVLERELRQQEDYIWELEDYLVTYSEKLRAARLAQCPPGDGKPAKSTSGTRRPAAGEPTLDEDLPEAPRSTYEGSRPPGSSSPRNASPLAPPAPPPDADDPLTEAPPADSSILPSPQSDDAEEIDPSEMEAPELEIGPGVHASPLESVESLAEVGAPELEADDGAILIPDPVDYQASEQESPELVIAPTVADEAGDSAIETLQLAAPQLDLPRLSADRVQICRVFGEPDPEREQAVGSLLVVVEALNATNEPVGADGETSLMIMLRDAPGSITRVDRWDFTAEETAAAWQSSHLGDGLHLELPLHCEEFPEGDLELWARLVTPDGRKLLTQVPFNPHELASLDEIPSSTALVEHSDVGRPLASADEAPRAATAEQPSALEKPAPQWRASSTRVRAGDADGYATPASAQASNAWASSAAASRPARVAQAPNASSATPPSSWKRSSNTGSHQSAPAAGHVR